MAASQLGIAIPNFWFAILLILLFAVKLQWVSAGGFPGWSEDDGGGLWPGLARCCCRRVAGRGAGGSVLARCDALGGAGRDARGLRAHGPRQGFVAARRPVAPRAAQRDDPGADGHGAAVRQPHHRHHRGRKVFVLPGMGRLVFQAIANRDLVVVRDVVLLLAAMVVW
jgi:peptide/nickel transport system permease protein